MASNQSQPKTLAFISIDKSKGGTDWLRLYCKYQGKKVYIYLRLPDSPENRIIAEGYRSLLESDLKLSKFDPDNVNKYRPGSLMRVEPIEPEKPPQLKFGELWERFVNDRSKNLKQSSVMEYVYMTRVLKRSSFWESSEIDALQMKEELLKLTTENICHKLAILLQACYRFGLKYKLVTDSPFEGFSKEFKKPEWMTNPQANPFSKDEMEAVIQAFKMHQGKGISYSYYAPFVEFLFRTGCRPSEAIGLTWEKISPSCSEILFSSSIVYVGGKNIESKKSKTNSIRKFPCNQQLRELLQSIKPSNSMDSQLVFSSHSGQSINLNDFRRRAWKTVVTPIKSGTSPYDCRSTFITLMIAAGVSSDIIAELVDNSPDIIKKHYLNLDAVAHIQLPDF